MSRWTKNKIDDIDYIPDRLFKKLHLKTTEQKKEKALIEQSSPSINSVDLTLKNDDQEAIILSKLGLKHNIFKHINSSYNTWSRIGFIIHNVLKENGLDLFAEISKNMGNFKSEEDVKANYNSFSSLVRKGSVLTFKTLVKLFKDSNTLKSKKIMKEYNEFMNQIEVDNVCC